MYTSCPPDHRRKTGGRYLPACVHVWHGHWGLKMVSWACQGNAKVRRLCVCHGICCFVYMLQRCLLCFVSHGKNVVLLWCFAFKYHFCLFVEHQIGTKDDERHHLRQSTADSPSFSSKTLITILVFLFFWWSQVITMVIGHCFPNKSRQKMPCRGCHTYCLRQWRAQLDIGDLCLDGFQQRCPHFDRWSMG